MPPDFDDRFHAAAGTVAGVDTPDAAGLTYRAFTSTVDAAACVALQTETWGAAFADHVPAALLHVATSIGGLAIGAFDSEGTLIGFVFSLLGERGGEAIHWSHMLAVRESARGAGVGRRLKELQRAELARRGIGRMLWTFDPLQARNAHLNFNRLGVRLVEYVEDMYGVTQSPLHHGLATDRLVVMLPTTPVTTTRPAAPHAMNGGLPVLTPFPRPGDLAADLTGDSEPVVLLEIPVDLQQAIVLAPDIAARWRSATRTHFQRALHAGYDVVRLRRDETAGRAFYVLAHPARASAASEIAP